MEELEKNYILLNLSTGQYHEIDSMGSRILDIIKNENMTRNDIERTINEMFYGDNIQSELNNFLDELISKEILIEA